MDIFRCNCSCADKCLIGKTGFQSRCTLKEIFCELIKLFVASIVSFYASCAGLNRKTKQ